MFNNITHYKMADGYIYCFSNPSMPGILKIGMTERTPDARLSGANVSDTWRPPTPYKIEIAKKVSNCRQKEKTLHALLEQYTDRINTHREFFRVSPEEIREFFNLMEGELWIETYIEKDIDEEDEEENTPSKLISQVKTTRIKGCRDMTKCFTDGQRIRHTICINKTWIGIYNSSINMIIYDGIFYKSMSKFALTHNQVDNPSQLSTGGWIECECEVNGKWVSTYSLPEIPM